MAETAQGQVARLVQFVAWMSQRDNDGPVTYRAAARHLGVSEQTVHDDLDTLIHLSEEYKPWLSSLTVGFTADGFVLQSRGHFRRPFRLTAEETVALVLGLAQTRGGHALAAKLGKALAKTPAVDRAAVSIGLGPTPSAHVEQVLGVAREALAKRRKLEINYCGSDGEPGRRVVQVHQIVQRGMWWYVVAWCEAVKEFRHFRADRVLEAKLIEATFMPQVLFRPVTRADEVFKAEATIPATVAFSPKIARWLKEKHPGGRTETDGRYVVTFRVADVAWFVREVLQYGAEAEVVGPASLREAVKKAVAPRG